MQIFLFVNGDDQHGVLRIQQLFGELQTFLHHGQPLAVTVLVVIVHIVVVVFPVLCAGIVGRIDIDAVNFSGIEVFQKLQSMVVICLDERVPQVAVRCVADRVNGLEIGVNGLAEFRHADKLLHRELCRGAFVLIEAGGNTVLDLEHGIKIVDMAGFERGLAPRLHRDIPQRRTLRQVLFKHQAEFLLFRQLLHLGGDPRAQIRVFYLCYQFIQNSHLLVLLLCGIICLRRWF